MYGSDDEGDANAWKEYEYEDDEEEEEEEEQEVISSADIRAVFTQFDLDESGYLDRSEAMAALVHFLPNESPRQINQRIRDADVNDDGKLSFKEFKAIARDVIKAGAAADE